MMKVKYAAFKDFGELSVSISRALCMSAHLMFKGLSVPFTPPHLLRREQCVYVIIFTLNCGWLGTGPESYSK